MKNMHQDLLGTGFYVTSSGELMTNTGHRVFQKRKVGEYFVRNTRARFYINKGKHRGKYLQCRRSNYKKLSHIKLTICDIEGFEYYNIPAKIIKFPRKDNIYGTGFKIENGKLMSDTGHRVFPEYEQEFEKRICLINKGAYTGKYLECYRVCDTDGKKFVFSICDREGNEFKAIESIHFKL